MGGKSRKTGQVSKKLIEKIKSQKPNKCGQTKPKDGGLGVG